MGTKKGQKRKTARRAYTGRSEEWTLEASGAGKITDFFGQPLFTKIMNRIEGLTVEVERTITGGWAIFSKKKK